MSGVEAGSATNTIHAVIGPVAGAAARVWIDNTRTIVEAIRAQPDKLPFRVPDGVTDEFLSYLDAWRVAAEGVDEFLWEGRTEPQHLRMLLTYWINIDRLTDRQLADLGVGWSPPAGEPFFHVLSAAIIAALLSNDELADFGENLSILWA